MGDNSDWELRDGKWYKRESHKTELPVVKAATSSGSCSECPKLKLLLQQKDKEIFEWQGKYKKMEVMWKNKYGKLEFEFKKVSAERTKLLAMIKELQIKIQKLMMELKMLHIEKKKLLMRIAMLEKRIGELEGRKPEIKEVVKYVEKPGPEPIRELVDTVVHPTYVANVTTHVQQPQPVEQVTEMVEEVIMVPQRVTRPVSRSVPGSAVAPAAVHMEAHRGAYPVIGATHTHGMTVGPSIARGGVVSVNRAYPVAGGYVPAVGGVQTAGTFSTVAYGGQVATPVAYSQGGIHGMLDGADGVMDGKYFGAPIVGTAPFSAAAQTAPDAYSPAVFTDSHTARAIDLADGKADGKFFGARIV